jgi:hypothetical protein
MQKWQYYAFQIRGDDLYHYKFEKNRIDIQLVQMFHATQEVLQANGATKARIWTAELGDQGWELTSIINYPDQTQEWIFKKPVQETPAF